MNLRAIFSFFTWLDQGSVPPPRAAEVRRGRRPTHRPRVGPGAARRVALARRHTWAGDTIGGRRSDVCLARVPRERVSAEAYRAAWDLLRRRPAGQGDDGRDTGPL